MTAGRAAAVTVRGVFDAGEHRATKAFRLVWGQAYDIAFVAGPGAQPARRPRDPHHGQDTR